jgi:hypothetical protein
MKQGASGGDAFRELVAIWAMCNRRPAQTGTSAALASQGGMQLTMLVEAVILGYTLARKADRADPSLHAAPAVWHCARKTTPG